MALRSRLRDLARGPAPSRSRTICALELRKLTQRGVGVVVFVVFRAATRGECDSWSCKAACRPTELAKRYRHTDNRWGPIMSSLGSAARARRWYRALFGGTVSRRLAVCAGLRPRMARHTTPLRQPLTAALTGQRFQKPVLNEGFLSYKLHEVRQNVTGNLTLIGPPSKGSKAHSFLHGASRSAQKLS